MAYPWWVFEKESNRQVRNTRLYGRKLGVVPASSNIFFVTVYGGRPRCRRRFAGFPITDSHDQEPTVYRHELVRALMLTVPCWKSFQPRPRARGTPATFLLP